MTNTRFAAALAVFAGCAPDLSDDLTDDTVPAGDAPTLDASDEEAWTAYDLDAGAVVDEADGTWDLRFRRVEIELNAAGALPVEVAILDAVDYDTVTEAPSDGFRVDDGTAPPIFFDWYVYDYETHVLTPADRVYVVHTTEDAYVKMVIVNYYDEAGTSGMYALDTDAVAPPTGGI